MHRTHTDLVSIITPAFRASTFIGETIKSVIAQTYPNWEMIIAEDCSPDDTREVIHQWTLVDQRIKMVTMDRNGGPALARNAALELAKGRWIAFLDSDDLWLPKKLERTIEYAQEHKAALVFTGFRRISADGSLIGRYMDVPRTLSYRQLLANTAIVTSTAVLDRNLVGEVRMKKVYYDDFACWLQILKRCHLAFGLGEDLMRYRVLSQSISRNKWRSAMHVWRTYRDLEKLNLLLSLWSFSGYAIRGLLKYWRF